MGACFERPSPGPELAWLPGVKLPFPEGTYSILELPHAVFHRAVLAVPMRYDAFLKYSAKRWPAEGWILSPTGEMEPGESENNFIRGETFGAFLARRVYCEGGWSEILLTIGTSPKNRPATTTTASTLDR